MTEEEAKRIIRYEYANTKNRLEALEVAIAVLGKNCTMSDIQEWAKKSVDKK